KVGTGSGTVTSSPSGLNCGATCSFPFPSGQIVILNSTPAAGSNFGGWSGNSDCIDGTVTMSTALTCTATFTLQGSTPVSTTTALVTTPSTTSVLGQSVTLAAQVVPAGATGSVTFM